MEQVVPLRRSKTETSESPYADGIEYVREWLRWLDAGIELRMCSDEGNRAKLEERWESARQRAELRTGLSEEANVFCRFLI